MAQDFDIQKEVWEGKLPIEFVLSEADATALQPPKPYYLLVPRVSYLPLVVDKVERYLHSFVDAADTDQLWLDYEGIPLKWHYPIGVLYDLLKTDDELPWQITVHFKGFPEGELLRVGSRDALEAHFLQTVKEADQLKHRADVINGMQRRDHKQLWNGLVNDRFDQFWAVNRLLMDSALNPIRHVPVRFYWSEGSWVQRLTPARDDAERRTTAADVCAAVGLDGERHRLLSHGVDVPADTPLLWLAQNLAYPDNFVHLCAVRRQPV